MKTAKDILHNKISKHVIFEFGGGIIIRHNGLNANLIIEAMEEYASQFKPTPSSTEINQHYFQSICEEHEFVEVEYTRTGTNEKSYTIQCKKCGFSIPTTPSSTLDGTHAMIKMACDTSSIVDLEREVKGIIGDCTCGEIYTSRKMIAPDCNWCNNGQDLIELIKGRQTTSQKGLDELIEWAKEEEKHQPTGRVSFIELITKATELLTKN